jgi:O-methyltransferase involved in polyketide biosynthesis
MEPENKKMHKIQLTEEKATLLMTLYAKSQDYKSERSILKDKKAYEICCSIEYDFTKLNQFNFGNLLSVRAKHYDEWIREFINSNQNAVVLYLGCGLDTRVSRINPPKSVIWFDVDYPEVIKLRKNFYEDNDNYKMISSSIAELKWLEEIPKDLPVIIVAEGVLEYLAEYDVEKIINKLTEYFSKGQMAFDIMNSFAIKSGKSSLKQTTGAVHKWAVDNIREVDKMSPKLRRINNISLFRSKYMNKIPMILRLSFMVFSLVPKFKNMIRLLRYEF